MGKGEKKDIALSVLSTAENNVLNVKKSTETALVYLEIKSEGATSFTISDKNTTRTFNLKADEVYTIKIHTDCTVTFDGATSVSYKEVVRDYAPLIPAAYANDKEPLHFNLWMTTSFNFE
jgi:hypothetical protein